jgi:hypothetical protein
MSVSVFPANRLSASKSAALFAASLFVAHLPPQWAAKSLTGYK